MVRFFAKNGLQRVDRTGQYAPSLKPGDEQQQEPVPEPIEIQIEEKEAK